MPEPRDLPAGAIEAYQAGATAQQVADRYGIGKTTVLRGLRRAGVAARSAGQKRRITITDEIADRYIAGESMHALGTELGIDEHALARCLRERGVTIRGKNSYPPHVEAAHAAVRGVKRSHEELLKRARVREARLSNTSYLEERAAQILDFAGIPHVRQKAIGKYNVDFALPHAMTVIEIVGGGYTSRKREHAPGRKAFLEDEGWRIIEVKPPVEEAIIHLCLGLRPGCSSGEQAG